MRVLLYAIEIPVAENPVAIPVPGDEFVGDTPYDVVRAMAGFSDSTDGESYMEDVRRRLQEWHGIDIGPIKGRDREERARNFLSALQAAGLATVEEK